MKPLVSILIPAYNAQGSVAETLVSAIGQTWPRTEIIVVDDGSTDNTLAIAMRMASRGVKVVTHEHQGAAASRNHALSLSQGDYIQWLDADDLLARDKIERQLSVLNDPPHERTLLSSAWGTFMYRPSRARFVGTALWQDLSPLEWLLRKMEQNAFIQTAAWLVSRKLTEAAGPWDTQLLSDDDGEYFCRVILQSSRVVFVPDARVFYRMSGARNLSYIGWSNEKMDAQLRSMRLQIGYLRSLEESQRVRAAAVEYLQAGLPNFYPHRPDLVAQAEQLAATVGGRLEMPRFSWKYSWIEAIFGSVAAKRAEIFLPRLRWSIARSCSKLAASIDKYSLPGTSNDWR
jgi:glycosyltransferase involved in cell wall biosynthesis